jgi:hypothetical protein
MTKIKELYLIELRTAVTGLNITQLGKKKE